MQGGVLELARQAAAAARADQQRRARGGGGAGSRLRNKYRGVTNRGGDRYVAEIMDADGLRPLYLGSYATPEEAAHAYDAAARAIHGNKAKPNFPDPEPPSPQQPSPEPPRGAAGGQRRPLLGHARARVRQTFSVPQESSGAAEPAFSQFVYRSSGAGSSAISFSTAAANGGSSNGGGGLFFGMAASSMIGPEPEVPMLTYAARSALSSSDKKNYKAVVVDDADPKLVIIIESDAEPVVEDNFTAGGASTSSSVAARPAVPPLRLKDLMEADVVRRSAEEGAP